MLSRLITVSALPSFQILEWGVISAERADPHSKKKKMRQISEAVRAPCRCAESRTSFSVAPQPHPPPDI